MTSVSPVKNGFTRCNQEIEQFIASVVLLLKEKNVIGSNLDEKSPVIVFQHPEKLKETLGLQLGERGRTDVELLEICRKVVHYSVRTGSPNFHNQLYAGLDPYGLAGAWISEALNTNQYTFEVGPAFTLAEQAIINRMLQLVGFKEGDGIFAPGGSMSNMYGIVAARYKKFPETKTKGISGLPNLVLFTSKDSHYSIMKGAHWLGFGTENVVKVDVDSRGRMCPSALRASISRIRAEGRFPLMVNATAGTTVLGAFDPLEQVADVCSEEGLWLHVDACWGGSLIFSKIFNSVLNGLHRADSLSWNPHKMLGAPLQCSLFLIKEKGLLHQCNSASATYLFQQDKFYDVSYDTGDKSLQCGRKVDAFKLWLMWAARGDLGLARLVDNAMQCSRYFKEKISNRKGFRLVMNEFDCTNICFWYIPKNLRGQEENKEWWEKVYQVAPKLKEKLIMIGSLMIGYQPLQHRGWGNFFRMVNTCHPPPTEESMNYVISQLEIHGEEL